MSDLETLLDEIVPEETIASLPIHRPYKRLWSMGYGEREPVTHVEETLVEQFDELFDTNVQQNPVDLPRLYQVPIEPIIALIQLRLTALPEPLKDSDVPAWLYLVFIELTSQTNIDIVDFIPESLQYSLMAEHIELNRFRLVWNSVKQLLNKDAVRIETIRQWWLEHKGVHLTYHIAGNQMVIKFNVDAAAPIEQELTKLIDQAIERGEYVPRKFLRVIGRLK